MARSKKLEALCEDKDNVTNIDQSFKELYEERFRQWLDSDVKLIQVTAKFRLSSVKEAAELAVKYFVRQSELSKPLTISGLTGALKLGQCSSLDLYKTYHQDYSDLIDEAKMVCEEYAEEQLFTKNSSGARFCLMNRNRWSNMEKSEVTTHNIDVKI